MKETAGFSASAVLDVQEFAPLKADVEALVGAPHQATMENLHLRQQLADRHAVIRALPTQAPLGR
ncbi:hypothetical protein GCM10010446_01110 [Streptomyces enissocaesilis]|uniref:Uncharacterized protein n=1 Tax=Streptomyces enissocaesilis TaxID=332589 RepID=A0ABN3WLY8_9ACTN